MYMKYILFTNQKAMVVLIGSIRRRAYWYNMYMYPDMHLLVMFADLQRINIAYVIGDIDS